MNDSDQKDLKQFPLNLFLVRSAIKNYELGKRLRQNLLRVNTLLSLHWLSSGALKLLKIAIPLPPAGESIDFDDVLRAAAVFLHASLEEFLRALTANYVQEQGVKVLKTIPVASLGVSHPSKCSVQDLETHRGKTVDELIDQSVDEWLHQKTYNNNHDIAAALASIGIDPNQCNSYFADIEDLLKRRHRIVHNVDRKGSLVDKSSDVLAEIDRESVIRWRNAVQSFAESVFAELYRNKGST